MDIDGAPSAAPITDASLRTSIDTLLEGVQIIGFDWSYRYLNQAAARHSRRRVEQLIGRTMMACYPGIEHTDLFEALQRVMESRQPERLVNQFTYEDGSSAWFELHIGPVPDGLSVLSLDVSAERAAAASHAAFRDRAAFAIGAAEAGIWEFDVLTGAVRWSEELSRMLRQRDRSERRIDDFLRLIHPDDLAGVEAAIAASMERDEPYAPQFRIVWPDGSVRWVAAKGRVTRNSAGEPTAMLGILIDITARRQLEEQLQQAQKMEALGQLAGGVAHDFNNVLTAIIGFGELLVESLPPGDPRLADVAEILKAGDSGRRLARQLLVFSRQQPLEPRLVDVNEIVKASEGILQQLLGKRIRLEICLAPATGQIHADAGQLQQILVNLAVNARDAMPDGGRLQIETRSERVEGDCVYTVLTVTDTGTGMPPEVITRIFEPFFTTKGPEKGTGLGLSTVYGIVRQSGGHVDLTSTPGIGTTFRIALPQASA